MSNCNKTKARSFTGCWACRFKKRRCDENKPFCSLCLRHGDQCSYDIRLVWQNENIFSVNENKELVSWKKLRNLCKQPNRNRISRRRFRQMTQFRQISPPNSDDEDSDKKDAAHDDGESDEDRDEKNDSSKKNTFTISVRRLKIYDNALDCVHGQTDKNFDQRFVDQQLGQLLTKLESSSQVAGDDRSGPFCVFKVDSFKKRNDSKKPVISRTSHETHNELSSLPNTPISETNSFLAMRLSTAEATSKFLSHHWPNLLLANDTNFCLQQPAYVKWLTTHIGSMGHLLHPDFLEELMNGSVDSSKWLSMIPHFSMECQALYLVLLVMAEREKDMVDFVSRWVLSQTQVSYLSFPLIAHSLKSCNKIAFLFHCHELLADATLQDLFQYELTSMLKINTVRLILQYWSNLMMDQICQCQDTTNSEMQLKFWEMQLQCNEEFYRDICLV